MKNFTEEELEWYLTKLSNEELAERMVMNMVCIQGWRGIRENNGWYKLKKCYVKYNTPAK